MEESRLTAAGPEPNPAGTAARTSPAPKAEASDEVPSPSGAEEPAPAAAADPAAETTTGGDESIDGGLEGAEVTAAEGPASSPPARVFTGGGWRTAAARRVVPTTPPGRALLGLMVIWGVLYLVALAQNLSDNRLDLGLDRGRQVLEQDRFLNELDPPALALLPIKDARFHRQPVRVMVQLLLADLNLEVDPGELALLPETSRSVALSEEPLHRVIHALVDDPAIGFSLSERRAHFFAQRLEDAEPPVGPLRQFEWGANVELSAEPSVFFPSARSDLWLVLALRPAEAGVAREGLAVEIWKGRRRLTSGVGELGPDRKVSLRFWTAGSLLVTAEAIDSPSAGEGRGARHQVRVFYQERRSEGVGPA